MADTQDRAIATAFGQVVESVFYRTSPFPCSYLPGYEETRALTEISPEMVESGFLDLLQHYGFRRSHNYFYRPICNRCAACIPVRLPVQDFLPNRTMRKLLRLNRDLTVTAAPPKATQEQFALFSRYLALRHKDSDMALMNYRDYQNLVENSPVPTVLFELRDANDRLYGCTLTDVGTDSMSAVYSFYDPEQVARSLGTMLILALVRECQFQNCSFLYLGYWIKECQKMAYKIRFRPIEYFDGHRWIAFA